MQASLFNNQHSDGYYARILFYSIGEFQYIQTTHVLHPLNFLSLTASLTFRLNTEDTTLTYIRRKNDTGMSQGHHKQVFFPLLFQLLSLPGFLQYP